jgi:hypothetical protein
VLNFLCLRFSSFPMKYLGKVMAIVNKVLSLIKSSPWGHIQSFLGECWCIFLLKISVVFASISSLRKNGTPPPFLTLPEYLFVYQQFSWPWWIEYKESAEENVTGTKPVVKDLLCSHLKIKTGRKL